MTDPMIRTQRSPASCIRSSSHPSYVDRSNDSPMMLPFPLVLLYCTQIRMHAYPPFPLLHALPFLVPRAIPNDQADRAGDTLSGKTGRRTKEGAPGCDVATSSIFVLRLPSAPRTNPTSRASRRAALGDCRSAAASMFSL